MRSAVVPLLFALACGGPSHSQLVETPSATARPRPTNAPPASTSDRDRERAVQQFEDMETTQRAYREAGESSKQDPHGGYVPPGSGKKAPVEQAPPAGKSPTAPPAKSPPAPLAPTPAPTGDEPPR
jgi:hypothetical protein